MPSKKELWLNPNTFATTLLLLFVDQYGMEPLNGEDPWDPEAIQLELQDDLGSPVPDVNLSKLLALQLHIQTDRFYTRLADFIRICNVLSGATTPDPDDPADVDEIVWALTEALLVEPPDTEEPFSMEIRRYIGEKLKDEGFLEPPDLLRLGIRTDRWQAILPSFQDRPELQRKIRESAQAKNDEIMKMLRTRLAALLDQLKGLRLESGAIGDIAERLTTALSAAQKQNT